MTYTLIWSEGAKKDLSAIGKTEYMRIGKKVELHLIKDPVNLGKSLVGGLSGLYRYRMGDYRVIYKIVKGELIVMVISVGHCKDVYE